jgi:hypothetical protein
MFTSMHPPLNRLPAASGPARTLHGLVGSRYVIQPEET